MEIDEKYRLQLSSAIESLKREECLDLKLIEEIIPNSKSEFEEFYSYYLDINTRKQFESLDEIIGNNAYKQKLSIFELYLRMAQYIDGKTVDEEYLRNYYYDLDFIIDKNTRDFCKLYSELDTICLSNLKDFYIDYCGN